SHRFRRRCDGDTGGARSRSLRRVTTTLFVGSRCDRLCCHPFQWSVHLQNQDIKSGDLGAVEIDEHSVAASKTSLVHDLFGRTADENYITARWCAVNGLQTDFLWLAVHALEKYLKAVLLLNGKTSKGYNHEIVELYTGVRALAGPLLPERLQRPQDLDIEFWR